MTGFPWALPTVCLSVPITVSELCDNAKTNPREHTGVPSWLPRPLSNPSLLPAFYQVHMLSYNVQGFQLC